jgi:hypothetical protein
MANKKFTPRASSNLIEEEVTENIETPVVEETTEVVTPEEVEETPVVETPTEEDKTDEVTFTAKTESKPIERMVKIRLAKKYDGCIGGEWYHFAKDQVVNVPENVKRILNKTEGMLKPL